MMVGKHSTKSGGAAAVSVKPMLDTHQKKVVDTEEEEELAWTPMATVTSRGWERRMRQRKVVGAGS